MRLLIGEGTNSTLESIEYATDACNINLIPDYVEPSERQEWVNLQEQVRLFQEASNRSNIITNKTEGKFSWKAFLVHGLHLSGHIQHEYQKIHSVPLVSHKKSSEIIDADISPYRYSNSSEHHISYYDSTTLPTLLNDSSTYEQDTSSGIEKVDYKDIINKEPNTIDLFESLGEHQHDKPSANSYIAIDQEVTIPVLVATSTSLLTKGWKYGLGTAGVALTGTVIYLCYKWIMDKIGYSGKEGVILPYDEEEYEPQTAMMIDFNGEKHLGSPSKYDIGIRNIDFNDLSIDDLGFIESRNINKPSENKLCLTLDDLQYDDITSKDSKLGLQNAITSSMNRDFYNRYLHPYLVKAFSHTGCDINIFKQDVYNNIINDLLKITFKTNLLSIGGGSYISTTKNFVYVITSDQLTYQNHATLIHIENNLNHKHAICQDFNIDLSYNNFYNDTLASLVISTTNTPDAIVSYKLNINFLQLRSCIRNIIVALLDELHDKPEFVTDNLLLDLVDCRNNISNMINVQFKHLEYNSKHTWNIVTSNIKSSTNPKHINNSFHDIFASIIIYCRILPEIEDMKNIIFNIQALIQNHNTLETDTENTLIAQNNKVKTNKLVAPSSTKAPVEKKDHNMPVVGLLAPPIIIPIVPLCLKCFIPSIDSTDNVELENIGSATNEIAESQSEERHNIDSSSEEDKDYIPKMKHYLPIIYNKKTPPIIAFREQAKELDEIYHGNKWAVYRGYPDIHSSGVPDNILQVQIKIKNAVHWLEDTLNSVNNLLKSRFDNQENFRYLYKYFKGALGVESITAINESLERMDVIIDKMVQYIQYSKSKDYTTFFVTSSSTVPVRGMKGYEHVSTLTADGIHTGAFVTRGDPSVVVISEFNQMTSFENKVHRVDKHNLYETLLHEVSHISSNSEDIMYIKPSYGGRLPSAQQGLNEFMQYINNNNYNEYVYALTEGFINTYNLKMDKIKLTRYLLEHDEVFRSNVMMTNADNIATFIRDLGARRNYNAPTPF